jgi:hemerythrin
MSQGKAKEVLGKILNDLAAYCATHFKQEELCLWRPTGILTSPNIRRSIIKMTAKVLSPKARWPLASG